MTTSLTPFSDSFPSQETDAGPEQPARIGWACAHVPLEIPLSAGLVPCRLFGNRFGRTPQADALLHSGTCRFVAGYLEALLENGDPSLTGFIASDVCAGARRVFDIVSWCTEIPFLFLLNVPNRATDAAVAFFKGELLRLITALETAFQTTVTKAGLNRAIKEMNTLRTLWRDLTQLRVRHPPALSGETALKLLLNTLQADPLKAKEHLTTALSEIKTQTAASPGTDLLRVLVTGSELDDPSFIALIESCGSMVVTEDLCTATPLFWEDIDTGKDPLAALARYYLTNPGCPNLYPANERLKRFAAFCERFRIDAVIHQEIYGCHLHGGGSPLFNRYLSGQGIPLLRLVRDYSRSGREQLRLRIEAFFEMVRGGPVSGMRV